MRYGICTGIENAGLVKKLGYDYIELSVTKTMGLDPAAYAAGKKALEESGTEAECFNILFPKTMNFVDGKTTSLDELETYLEKAMAMIADLHGKVVVFGSGKCRTCPPEVKYLDAYENLVKACRLTGEIAGRYGIRAVIEPKRNQYGLYRGRGRIAAEGCGQRERRNAGRLLPYLRQPR